MTTPVTGTPSISPQNETPTAVPTSVPGGIGTQPTTLSPAVSSSGLWGSISNLVYSAMERILSFLNTLAGWFLGSSSSSGTTDTAVQWQLPAETQPISPETQPISQPATPDPFAALMLNAIEQQKIFDIFHTLGTSHLAALPFHLSRLNRLGQEVDHVHPFKLLEYLCKHPILVRDLDAMRGSSFTWRPFVEGVSGKMVRDSATLPSCKSGFARSMNVNLTDLEPFFLSNNWEGMALFLLDVKHGRRISVWLEPASTVTPPPVTTTADLPPPPTTTVEEIVAPPCVQIADLPFDGGDEEILAELVSKYVQIPRWRLLYEHYSLQLLWSHLGARHALKILSHLYSKPKFMDDLDTILQYYGTRLHFLRALSAELAKTSFVEVRPYIEDFASTCHLDPIQVKRLIKDGQWHQLVEQLLRSYQANPSV